MMAQNEEFANKEDKRKVGFSCIAEWITKERRTREDWTRGQKK